MNRALSFTLTALFLVGTLLSLGVNYLIWKDIQYFKSTQNSAAPLSHVSTAMSPSRLIPSDEDPHMVVLKAKRAQVALEHNANTQLMASAKAGNNEDACFTLHPTDSQTLPYRHHLAALNGRTHNLFLFSGVPAQLSTQKQDTVVSQDFNGVHVENVLHNTSRENASRIIGLCFQS